MHHPRLGFILFIAAMGLVLPIHSAQAQTRIDSSFAFQTDPAKRFALYVPSGYEAGVANKALLAFHPFHAVWGNSTTWCNILTNFAEENNLLMICPDGGPNDLRVDDPIDLAFTTALLDSLRAWYTVDVDKTFILGFSWGGRATYTYGLTNPDVFAGFITIGSFINGTAQVGPALLANSENKPFYIMHGDSDAIVNLQTGFFPIRDALVNAGALVNSLILENVGHTIDFPNRDRILTDAFRWVDSTSTALTSVGVEDDIPVLIHQPGILSPNYPNPFRHSTRITYAVRQPGQVRIQVYNVVGQVIRTLIDERKTAGEYTLHWDGTDDQGKGLPGGTYFYTLTVDHSPPVARSMIVVP